MSTSISRYYSRIIIHITIIAMIVAVIGVACAAQPDEIYAASKSCKVSVSKLYVRAGAGVEYDALGMLNQGDEKKIYGSKKDSTGSVWYKVKIGKKKGYVCGRYVNIKKLSSSKKSSKSTKFIGVVSVASGSLFVRSAPGTNNKTIGSVNKGVTLNFIGKKKDSNGNVWYKLKYKGKNGYVYGKYITLKSNSTKAKQTSSSTSKKSTKSSSPVKLSSFSGKVDITSGKLFVRNDAGVGNKVIGSVKKGKKLNFTGTKKANDGKTWYRLKFKGKTGYVIGEYIKVESSAKKSTTNSTATSTTAPTTTTQPSTTVSTVPNYNVTTVTGLYGKVKISSGHLFVRSEPTTSGEVIGTFKKGKVIEINGKITFNSMLWYRFNYDNRYGYVCGAFIETSTTKPEEPTEPVEPEYDHAKAEKARKDACNWAIKIAADNSFHYGKPKWAHHNGCYYCGSNGKGSIKVRSGATVKQASKTYCCNPFVTAAYAHGAQAEEVDCTVEKKRFGLANDKNYLLKHSDSFYRVSKPSSIDDLVVGDILLTPTHCMLYIGDGKIAHAKHHDNGKRGSYWNESICVEKMPKNQFKRTTKIYRYIGTGKY